jgi:Uma2 family endonuclease
MDVWIDRHNVLQPDVLVTAAPLPPDAGRVGVPLLAVEVLSASTAERDRGVKTATYLRAGVAEVWLVDPDAGTVEVRTPRESRATGPSGEVASAVLGGPLCASDLELAPPATGSPA